MSQVKVSSIGVSIDGFSAGPDQSIDNPRFDAAIGGGFALASSVVARELTPLHIVAVASPASLAGRALPRHPDDLAGFDGIMRRSAPTGRLRAWTLRARRGVEQPMPFAVAPIASGELVRLLPGWYSDAGPLSLYDPSRRLLPAKTRLFVDFVVERFCSVGFARLVDSRPPDNHQPHADRQ